jgi:allantoicase
VEIDTANFMGNFPESCEMHAMNVAAVAAQKPQLFEGEWTLILPRNKLGLHRRHFFLLGMCLVAFTHMSG